MVFARRPRAAIAAPQLPVSSANKIQKIGWRNISVPESSTIPNTLAKLATSTPAITSRLWVKKYSSRSLHSSGRSGKNQAGCQIVDAGDPCPVQH